MNIPKSIKVDDLVRFNARLWVVTGIYYGVVGEEDLATIVSMDKTVQNLPCLYEIPAGESDQSKIRLAELIVPMEFLTGNLYRSLDESGATSDDFVKPFGMV